MSPSSSSFATVMFIMSVVRRVCSTWKLKNNFILLRKSAFHQILFLEVPISKGFVWNYKWVFYCFLIFNALWNYALQFYVLVFKSMIGAMVFYGLLLPLHFFRKRSWMTSTCVAHFDIETHVWPQKLGEKRTIRPIKKPLPAPSNVRRAPCIQVWSQCEIYWT